MPRLTEVDPNVPRPKGTKGASGFSHYSSSSAPSSNVPHIFSPTSSAYHGSGTPATTYSYASLKYDGSPMGGVYPATDLRDSPAPSHHINSSYPSTTPFNSPYYSSPTSFDGSLQSSNASFHSSRRTSLLSQTHSHLSPSNPTLSPFASPYASSISSLQAGAGAGIPSTPGSSGFNTMQVPPPGSSSSDDVLLNPLLNPGTLGIFFDVTRPLTSVTITPHPSSPTVTVYDQATSPGIKSGYLILEFTFEGMHSSQNSADTKLQCAVSSNDGFLSQGVSKNAVASNRAMTKGQERAQRRGRSFICWMDFVRDGTMFCGLRVKDTRTKYVVMEVLLRQP
ncbi:hypothetical protein VNI00_013815 [Paramarasmius palmivorus]|uniref:Uncharacterized protein n=1 Tax=Paramarasmius palmivorus TaxID=297713 RepID=A0AAW0BX90_9AGAR